MKKCKIVSGVACGALSLVLCQLAVAQQAKTTSAPPSASAASSSKTQLSKVEVTGSRYLTLGSATVMKMNVPVRDIPFSVSTYTSAFLKSVQATKVADLYKYMTGVSRAGNTGYDIVFRGFKTGGNDLNAILIDGLPGLPVRFGSPLTFGLSRVEVVRGPDSILYGQEQPGGFINLITKKPLPVRQAELRLRATAQNASSGQAWGTDAAFDYTGPIDSSGKLLYRFIGELANTHTFRENGYERPLYLAPSLTWNIDPRTALTTQFVYHRTQTSYDTYLVAPNLDINLVAPIYTRYQQPSDFLREIGRSTTFLFHHDFWNGMSLHVDYRYVYHTDLANGFDVVSIRPNNQFVERRARGQLNHRTYSFGDVYLSIPATTGPITHNVLVGAQYGIEIDDFQRLQFYNAPAPPNPLTADISIYNPDYGTALPLAQYPLGSTNDRYTKSTDAGIYASDLMTFSPKWKGLVGMRFSPDKQLFYYKEPTGKPQEQSSNHGWTPWAGIIYQPADNLSFYASYSSSFVPPKATAIDVNGNHSFGPSKGNQIEVGTKDQFWNGRGSISFAIYKIKEYNVLQTFHCAIGTCSAPVGEEQSKGAEIEANIQPLDGWQILAGYSYTDASIVDSLTTAQNGAELQNVPRNSAHVWTRYDIQTGKARGLGFGLGEVYESERAGTLPSASTSKILELPSYLVTDAGVYYDFGDAERQYEISFAIHNVFNKTYYESAGYNGEINIVPGTPRTFVLTFTNYF